MDSRLSAGLLGNGKSPIDSGAFTDLNRLNQFKVGGDTEQNIRKVAQEFESLFMNEMLKAMRSVRPQTVRQFFALANQHMLWQLNDLARRSDERPAAVELREGLVPAPVSSESGITPDGRRMLEAIDNLPQDEREVFGLVRDEAGDQLGDAVAAARERRVHVFPALLLHGLEPAANEPDRAVDHQQMQPVRRRGEHLGFEILGVDGHGGK